MIKEELENMALKEFRKHPEDDEFEVYGRILTKVWNMAIETAAKSSINKSKILKLKINENQPI